MSDEPNNVSGFTWIEDPETIGEMLFTFDGQRTFNLFRDYPHELTPDQKKLFDHENPFWADFFKDRTQVVENPTCCRKETASALVLDTNLE